MKEPQKKIWLGKRGPSRTLPCRAITEPEAGWFPCIVIARVLRCDKKTVRDIGKREDWPSRKRKNLFEYRVPVHIAGDCENIVAKAEVTKNPPELAYAQIINDRRQRARVLNRLAAVSYLKRLLGAKRPVSKEKALSRAVGFCDSVFKISERSAQRWLDRYDRWGLTGLTDQRPGRSGRKSCRREAVL